MREVKESQYKNTRYLSNCCNSVAREPEQSFNLFEPPFPPFIVARLASLGTLLPVLPPPAPPDTLGLVSSFSNCFRITEFSGDCSQAGSALRMITVFADAVLNQQI